MLAGEAEALGIQQPLHVCGLDSGTWPVRQLSKFAFSSHLTSLFFSLLQADGGGVASCRRDLVDRIGTLRWDQISEIGNPMKVATYNIEENVSSLCMVPLWGSVRGRRIVVFVTQ